MTYRYSWTPEQKALIRESPDRNRTRLLVFKGTVSKDPPWWWNQHRVVAANYLHAPSRGIVIDTQSPTASSCGAAEDYGDFADQLLSSDFALAPGRGGPNSYRFAETLISGAIPVVMIDDSSPLPFVPDIEDGPYGWSDCVVNVHETRIVALEAALLALRPELPARRKACAHLLHHTVGDDEGDTFKLALKVWARRIRHVFAGKN